MIAVSGYNPANQSVVNWWTPPSRRTYNQWGTTALNCAKGFEVQTLVEMARPCAAEVSTAA